MSDEFDYYRDHPDAPCEHCGVQDDHKNWCPTLPWNKEGLDAETYYQRRGCGPLPIIDFELDIERARHRWLTVRHVRHPETDFDVRIMVDSSGNLHIARDIDGGYQYHMLTHRDLAELLDRTNPED